MIIVKVKNEERTFTIPVPYIVLRLGTVILTSRLVHRKFRDWVKKHDKIEPVLLLLENRGTKHAIKHLIREMRRCKGTILVDVHSQDGTEVLIRL
ncbi:hypothetical protein [Paenibacillus albus]|uniref:Uncharacterized protein n=1 Tax=Paenibacillus albus TaxID=2495582 RepID=A0A3Q8X650_9BACL|nr:hypothetical protein [Paenibacillus albus]AZN41387.1 hypothetical protein EJC50_18195 [Paenibacillus albus]